MVGNIAAEIVTYTILGGSFYNYSRIDPQSPIPIIKAPVLVSLS